MWKPSLPASVGNKCRPKSLASIGISFYNMLIDMETVKVSSKFQIVIPREVRERLNLKPGDEFKVVNIGGTVKLIPVRSAKEMRGRFADIDTNIEREEDRL
jgi:AbrB family looped-hinge helix DNA binding protein